MKDYSDQIGAVVPEEVAKLVLPIVQEAYAEGERAMRGAEPLLWAIADTDGTLQDGENCVFFDAVSAEDDAMMRNEEFPEDEPEYYVVPLFRALPVEAAPATTLPTSARRTLAQKAQDCNCEYYLNSTCPVHGLCGSGGPGAPSEAGSK